MLDDPLSALPWNGLPQLPVRYRNAAAARSPLEGVDGCRWSLRYSPPRSLDWLAPTFACLGVCRPSLLTELMSSSFGVTHSHFC